MFEYAKEIKPALILFMAFALLTGVVYPLFITGIVQTALPAKAEGSLIVVDGRIVGSELIGQTFQSPGYFHGRPSAVNYAANGSGAGNLGPTSARLMEEVSRRIDQVRHENRMYNGQSVPADLVQSSGSGLDPHISRQAAMEQVARVAGARGLAHSAVQALIDRNVEPAVFGILGQERVNVLRLNLDLDNITGVS
ncbi:MAG: potassium-transporting ATPase subunit KdpC [Methanothrix sp.]|nr:potassium-transporting ATPase subunit KdpC [Methanothrix sp.]MDD4446914.1 potassium-transporting ATPase subunit KdpC [Methanothrix sp.]